MQQNQIHDASSRHYKHNRQLKAGDYVCLLNFRILNIEIKTVLEAVLLSIFHQQIDSYGTRHPTMFIIGGSF
jgi:hypothetical protein